MRYYQFLILTLIFGYVILKNVSGVARVKRSADRNLRDPGTYIVNFATDAQLHHFAKQLRSWPKFEAKIIAEYPSIKFLIAKLSNRALKWVSINMYVVVSCSQKNTMKHS